MSDSKILNFPSKEKVDANHILNDAMDKLEDCVVLGTTKDGEVYFSICAQDSEQVIYLLRLMEHLVIAQDLS
jgi:hypothetical protein